MQTSNLHHIFYAYAPKTTNTASPIFQSYPLSKPPVQHNLPAANRALQKAAILRFTWNKTYLYSANRALQKDVILRILPDTLL